METKKQIMEEVAKNIRNSIFSENGNQLFFDEEGNLIKEITMKTNKQIMVELLTEVREWEKQWTLNPNSIFLKSIDEFADELSKKYNVTKQALPITYNNLPITLNSNGTGGEILTTLNIVGKI